MRKSVIPLACRRGADLLANLVLEITILFDLDQVLFALLFCPRPRSAGYAMLEALQSASVTVNVVFGKDGH